MATPEYVTAQLGPLEAGTKRVLSAVFRYVLGNLRMGRPGSQARAENWQAYFLTGTTAAVANEEFSILHGLGVAPYLLVPVLDLSSVNAALVPLTVTKVPDAARIYLSSSVTSAPITVLVEAAS